MADSRAEDVQNESKYLIVSENEEGIKNGDITEKHIHDKVKHTKFSAFKKWFSYPHFQF